MKKLLFFILISLTVNQLAQAQTESIDRFVRKYKRSATGEKVDITVPGWLVRIGTHFIDNKDLEGVDIQAIARKISEVRIVSIEGGAKIPSSDIQKLNSKKDSISTTIRPTDRSSVKFNLGEWSVRGILFLLGKSR